MYAVVRYLTSADNGLLCKYLFDLRILLSVVSSFFFLCFGIVFSYKAKAVEFSDSYARVREVVGKCRLL
ncbi:hypothetical protein KKB_07008 [Kingella kingae PYKK081]|nr:hypothetical protein KKB_07008 [Kingella kingae PYKK081]